MIGEEVEREKEMDLNVTVGMVFASPHCGPFLITKRPMGAGVSVNALTVLMGLSFGVFASMMNCFVLSSNVIDSVSTFECLPPTSLTVSI